MNFNYYYNNVPGEGLSRNNLIYTSLISQDQKIFCQWFYNDGEYHKGQNQVLDPALMQIKWEREIKYLTLMAKKFPSLVPNILDIDYGANKIFLEIDGLDFWNRSACTTENYDNTLIDWQDQMLEILAAHKSLGLYKYSMHPSSYFIVNGKLKSINYFFAYHESEGPITIADHLSHIYSTRQEEMRKYTEYLSISWTKPEPLERLEQLCWDSFSKNYPKDFIEKAKCIK
jgi:hypothetical protein